MVPRQVVPEHADTTAPPAHDTMEVLEVSQAAVEQDHGQDQEDGQEAPIEASSEHGSDQEDGQEAPK